MNCAHHDHWVGVGGPQGRCHIYIYTPICIHKSINLVDNMLIIDGCFFQQGTRPELFRALFCYCVAFRSLAQVAMRQPDGRPRDTAALTWNKSQKQQPQLMCESVQHKVVFNSLYVIFACRLE